MISFTNSKSIINLSCIGFSRLLLILRGCFEILPSYL
nr:MAG TPA: hypothetical protein [Caudoviricetes sp.]